ncbi:unnamed protein product [Ascophyllum nodosum]
MKRHPRPRRQPTPSHLRMGFGRTTTKPPWFDCRIFDKERRDFGWVIKDFSSPDVEKEGRKAASAPFVHDTDTRLYRPTVPQRGRLSVEVPATPSSRTWVTRDVESSRYKGEKLIAMQDAYRRSHLQMLANLDASRRSEVRETICGRGRTINKPLLYPKNVTHQQALNLEHRGGQSLPYDSKLKPQSRAEPGPLELWNQHMYLPFSRTRSDFPGLTS